MVHKKYTWKNGKRYGPYLYENKRVNGEIKTSYLGKSKTNRGRNITILIIGTMFLIVTGYLALNNKFSPTGKAAFDVSLVYKEGELLAGDLNFRVKEGEFIPKDSRIVIEYGNTSKTFSLSELIENAPTRGVYYAERASLDGSGEGYGTEGSLKVYPIIDFDLLIYNENAEEEVSSAPAAENQSEEIELSPPNESGSEEEEQPTENRGAGQQENQQESGEQSEEQNPESFEGIGEEAGSNAETQENAEQSSEGAVLGDETEVGASEGNAASEGGESAGIITGGAVSEDEYEIHGTVSKDNYFTYDLEEGKSAKIVSGSVKINGSAISDGAVNLEIDGGVVEVTTDYFIEQKGYGEEFLGDYGLTLHMDVKDLELPAQQGIFKVQLAYNNAVIASSEEEVDVEIIKQFNETLKNESVIEISLIKEIPNLRIAKGKVGKLDLGEYFTGAERYEFEGKNLNAEFKEDWLILTPEEDFSGAVRGKIIAYSGDEKLESNVFNILVSSGAVNVKTSREEIRVGEPVKWKKEISLENNEKLEITIPAKAEKINVKKVENGVEKEASVVVVENSKVVTGGVITGEVVIELNLKKKSLLQRIIEFIKKGITGRTVSELDEEENINEDTSVVLNSSAEGYIIEYETEAPDSIEEETKNGKVITVSGPDNLVYEDVIAYTSLPLDKRLRVGQEGKIKVYWTNENPGENVELKEVEELPEIEVVEEIDLGGEFSEGVEDISVEEPESIGEGENLAITGNVVEGDLGEVEGIVKSTLEGKKEGVRQEIPFDAYDLDGDEYLDYLEWVVPHLSNQTFEIIIEISGAEHLDSNKTFISDIYPEVSQLDGNWSEAINSGEYVKVTFKQNLTRDNDITIYPRIVNGTPRIEVYEQNWNETIASFDNLIENEYNKVYLTNLTSESQDVFDLLVVGGSLEFDHIIDPTLNVSDYPSSVNNVTVENNFSHLSIGHSNIGFINTSNLVLYMPFDTNNNSAGKTYDYSGNSNDGSCVSASNQCPTFNNSGMFGSAYLYNGASTGWTIPTTSLNINSFSVGAWVKLNDNITINKDHIIFSNGISSNNRLFLEYQTFSGPGFTIGANGVWNTKNTTFNDINRWYFVLATFDFVADSYKLYIDGVLSAQSTATDNAPTLQSTAEVGRYYDKTFGFNGTIDEFILINGTLTASQVASLYANQSSRFFARGEQIFKNLNVSTASTDTINITINSTMLFGSMINVSVGNQSGSDYAYGAEYAFTNKAASNIPIGTPSNISLKFIFYAGDSSTNSFYSPTLENNILVISNADTTLPVVNLIAPQNGTTVTNANVGFNATFSDNNALANATFYLWNSTGSAINTTTQTLSGTTGSINLTVVLPYGGTFSWNYLISDLANNMAFNNTNWTLIYNPDTIAPTMSVAFPLAGVNYTYTNISLNVSSTASDISTWFYSLNGAANVTFTPNTTFVATQGSNTIVIYVNDTSNNVNSTSRNFYVDSIPPLFSIVYPQNTSYNSVSVGLNVSYCEGGTCIQPSETIIANVQFQGTLDDPNPGVAGDLLGRCVRFTLKNNQGASVIVQSVVNIPVDDSLNGTHIISNISVTASQSGFYTCLTARDRLHTLENATSVYWDSQNARYVANRTPYLEGGNINDDRYIDILDFSSVQTRFGTSYTVNGVVSGNTTCGTSFFHVDISGDGQVDAKDQAFVNNNLGHIEVDSCADVPVISPISIWWYSLNGGANTTFTPNSVVTPVQGSNTLIVYVNDSYNNVNSSSVVFFVDSIAPTISIAFPIAGVNYTYTNISLNVSSTASDISTWFYSLNGAANVTFTPNTTFVASQGYNNLTVYLNDSYNNVNSSTVTFYVDSLNPQISFGFGTENNGEVSDAGAIYVNVSVNETNEQAIVFKLYNSSGQVNLTSFTNQRRTINWTGLPDGVYTYNVTVNDSIGNINSTSSRTITLVSSCLGATCVEGSDCNITRACILHNGLCAGGICDFGKFRTNSTIYTLYDSNGNGRALDLNLSGNITFLVSNTNFVLSGKNGSSISPGNVGGNASVFNLTVPGLLNTTNFQLIGIGGYSTLNGSAGGNGGIVQLNYHGLIRNFTDINIDEEDDNRPVIRSGNSTNGTSGTFGTIIYNKDGKIPRDPDITNDGVVDFGGDVAAIIANYRSRAVSGEFTGYSITGNTSLAMYDINNDTVVNVLDLYKVGFEYETR